MNRLTDKDYQHALNIKALLGEKFGNLIYKVYCYGSRVTEQKQDTDFDLIIITSEKVDWQVEDRISDVLFYYGLEHDILFDDRCFSKDEFEDKYKYMPFISEVKSYGIAI